MSEPDTTTAATRDIADVAAVEVITTAAVHLMSAAAVKCGLAADEGGGSEYLDLDEARKLITALASIIAFDVYPCTLGSRILGGHAFSSGMPWWRYFSNRVLTLFQNIALNAKLSEYHTGYRAFSRQILEEAPLDDFDDDFIFDNQMLVWILGRGYGIGEVTCPTRYFEEASSISFARSVKYGLGCLGVSLQHRLSPRAPTRRARAAR